MKIVIGIPAPELVPIKFVESLIGIISYTHSKSQELGITELNVVHAGGVRTDKNRNTIIQQSLEHDADYILWLDADMVFQHDIVERYFKDVDSFDVIGCLYFKRSYPYSPVAYIKNEDPNAEFPWYSLDPDKLPKNKVLEVDGLGFGGVMVNTNVYKKMGDDKWMNYDTGFHLPFKNKHGSTHDLVWCRNAQKYGYKIYLHTGVLPSHLATKEVTIEDWRANKNEVGTK